MNPNVKWFVAIAFFSVSSSAAIAVPFPYTIDGTFTVAASGGVVSSQSVNAPLSTSVTKVGPGLGGGDVATGTIDVAVAPNPLISMSAALSTPAAFTGVPTVQGTVTLKYYMEITGPTLTVPTLIIGNGGVSVTPFQSGNSSSVSGSFQVAGQDFSIPVPAETVGLTSSGTTFQIQVHGTDVPGTSGGFNYSKVHDLRTDIYYIITLQLAFNSNISVSGTFGSQSVSAFIDPMFFIADFVENRDQYKITFSEGIGNGPVGSDVPLPATAPMMFGAVVGGGLLLRRLRRRANPGV